MGGKPSKQTPADRRLRDNKSLPARPMPARPMPASLPALPPRQGA